MTSDEDLFEMALKARENAYAHYSGFHVGAAILDETGAVHTGCNVENAAYPLGSCAEAGAISAMARYGGRAIKVIAILGGRDALEDCAPCRGCRQRIAEFADNETRILLKGAGGAVREFSIAELLPHSFTLGVDSK